MRALCERCHTIGKRLECITLHHPIRFTGGFGPGFIIAFDKPCLEAP